MRLTPDQLAKVKNLNERKGRHEVTIPGTVVVAQW